MEAITPSRAEYGFKCLNSRLTRPKRLLESASKALRMDSSDFSGFARRDLLWGALLPAMLGSSGLASSAEVEAPLLQSFSRAYFGMQAAIGRNGNDESAYWPELGAGAVRLWDNGVAWRQLEPSRGRYEWEKLDQLVTAAMRRGLDILMCLGQAPPWATGGISKSTYGENYNAIPPSNPEDWVRYVGRVAERYRGRISAYEVWNEPNLPGFYAGDIAYLVQLVRTARTEIKRIDPSARIVSPSVTTTGGDRDGPRYLKKMVHEGLMKYVDVVGVHLYVDPKEPVEVLSRMMEYRAALTARPALPIWNTEVTRHHFYERGRVVASPDAQLRGVRAVESVIALLLFAWLGGCSRSYWYGIGGNWSAISFLISGGSDKFLSPARAYKSLSLGLQGFAVSSISRSDEHILVGLRRGQHQGLILFPVGDGVSCTITYPHGATLLSSQSGNWERNRSGRELVCSSRAPIVLLDTSPKNVRLQVVRQRRDEQ